MHHRITEGPCPAFWLATHQFRWGRLYCLLFVFFYFKKEKEQKRAENKNLISVRQEFCSGKEKSAALS